MKAKGGIATNTSALRRHQRSRAPWLPRPRTAFRCLYRSQTCWCPDLRRDHIDERSPISTKHCPSEAQLASAVLLGSSSGETFLPHAPWSASLSDVFVFGTVDLRVEAKRSHLSILRLASECRHPLLETLRLNSFGHKNTVFGQRAPFMQNLEDEITRILDEARESLTSVEITVRLDRNLGSLKTPYSICEIEWCAHKMPNVAKSDKKYYLKAEDAGQTAAARAV
jgi:hypothetical protein